MLRSGCMKRCPGITRRACSTAHSPTVQAIRSLNASYDSVDIDEFRREAFVPQTPLLISPGPRDGSANTRNVCPSISAAYKWFNSSTSSSQAKLSYPYLSTFSDTILPYELEVDTTTSCIQNWLKDFGAVQENIELATVLTRLLRATEGKSFHRFNAPLSFFLQASQPAFPGIERLYIAQAQISDLPQRLQGDLLAPRLVREAGRGDIYDSNIWVGLPPTYTPLHKDPNPNLFVQLASSKKIRLFEPSVGIAVFHEVQRRIGHQSSPSFRGYEMMEGIEKEVLDIHTWGTSVTDVFETDLSPGDALFIPKGWWHSIKSVGKDVNASVNWWFR